MRTQAILIMRMPGALEVTYEDGTSSSAELTFTLSKSGSRVGTMKFMEHLKDCVYILAGFVEHDFSLSCMQT